MKIKCDYCGSMIDEAVESCPHCGAHLSGVNRTASSQPKTIEDLKAWYEAHNLPPEEITRFFIGKNIKEPKAFGIYKTDTGDCVVYKNKSTGERAIRYQGSDEAYAVNELYQRLRAEIADQKRASRSQQQPQATRPASERVADMKKKKRLKGCGCLTIILAVLFGFGLLVALDDTAPHGYYNYQGKEYYNQYGTWYQYDEENDNWIKAASLSEIINDENYKDYEVLSTDHQGMRFEESSWYDDGSSYHSDDDDDWDNDYSWDSDNDSWSSSSTDWDSDW